MNCATSTPEEEDAPNHAYVCVCMLKSFGGYSWKMRLEISGCLSTFFRCLELWFICCVADTIPKCVGECLPIS